MIAVLLWLALVPRVDAAARVGAAAPTLTLPGAGGREVTLAELHGRVVVLDFWASWCGSCAKALPKLDSIARRFAADGLTVLAASIDESRERADRYVAERLPGSPMTFLYDPGGAAMGRFGAEGMPALFLIDRDGVVRATEIGYVPERLDEVERTIAALLASPPQTAARPDGAARTASP